MLPGLLLVPHLMVPAIGNPFVPGNLGVLLTFGLLFGVIASGVHNIALSRARPMHSSVINNSESIFASLWAFAILGERLGIHTILGGILILGASIWLALRRKGE